MSLCLDFNNFSNEGSELSLGLDLILAYVLPAFFMMQVKHPREQQQIGREPAVPSSLILQEKCSLLSVLGMCCKVRQVSQHLPDIWWKESEGSPSARAQPFPHKYLRASNKCLSFRELVEEPWESQSELTNFSCGEGDLGWMLWKLTESKDTLMLEEIVLRGGEFPDKHYT